MSWIKKLYDTYEACESMVGLVQSDDEKEVPLLPICHTTQKAQIEIVINGNGSFQRAHVISKSSARTIIPCTESSGGRTSGMSSHPLCDKLQYVAGDYTKYGGNKESYFCSDKEDTYKNLLSKWCNSEFANKEIKAILKYIENENVIKDLVEHKILFVDDNNQLMKQWKANDKAVPEIFSLLPGKYDEKKDEWNNWQAEAFIRWRVEISGELETAVWKNKDVIESWIKYYSRTKEKESFCHVTGLDTPFAEQHPAKIRNDGDKAKLISSNDLTGYTFRGRFLDASQACDIGYEATQRAHNALRWLISRQGYRKGDQAIVAWSVSGKDIPDIMSDTYSLIDEDDLPDDAPSVIYTAQDYGIKLRKKISGYNQELKDAEGIVVLGLDSATPGRMAITFYRELTNSDFLQRVENWHSSCAWFHDYRTKEIQDDNGKKKIIRFRFTGAPAPGDIALVSHGHYENEILKVDDKIRKSTVERLLPCIIDGQKLPRDLVESTIRKASNRIGFKKDNDWNKTLSIACALYRKYHEKENYSMALDENRTKRDYLYGRLLALADSLEQWALYKAGDKRQTNAARLMQRFADHPYSTWRSLELSLIPYKARLGGISTNRQRLIDKVKNMFESVDDFENDKPLSGEFLLAYSCQKEALREASLKAKLAKEGKNKNISNIESEESDFDEDYQE